MRANDRDYTRPISGRYPRIQKAKNESPREHLQGGRKRTNCPNLNDSNHSYNAPKNHRSLDHTVGRVPCATFTIFRVSRTAHRQNLAQSTDFVLILRTTSATEYLSLVCDTASSETSLCFLSKTQMSSEGSIANKGHPQKSLVEGVEQISEKTCHQYRRPSIDSKAEPRKRWLTRRIGTFYEASSLADAVIKGQTIG